MSALMVTTGKMRRLEQDAEEGLTRYLSNWTKFRILVKHRIITWNLTRKLSDNLPWTSITVRT